MKKELNSMLDDIKETLSKNGWHVVEDGVGKLNCETAKGNHIEIYCMKYFKNFDLWWITAGSGYELIPFHQLSFHAEEMTKEFSDWIANALVAFDYGMAIPERPFQWLPDGEFSDRYCMWTTKAHLYYQKIRTDNNFPFKGVL